MNVTEKFEKWIDERKERDLLEVEEEVELYNFCDRIENAKKMGALYANVIFDFTARMWMVEYLDVEMEQVEYNTIGEICWWFIDGNALNLEMLDLRLTEHSRNEVYVEGLKDPLITEEFFFVMDGATGNIFNETFEITDTGFIAPKDSWKLMNWLDKHNIDDYTLDNSVDGKIEVFIRDLGHGKFARF